MRKNKRIIIWILSALVLIGVLVCFIIFFPNISDKVSGFFKQENTANSGKEPGPSEMPSKGLNGENTQNVSGDNKTGNQNGNNQSDTYKSELGFPYTTDGLIKKDAREVFYDCINLNDRLKDGMYADIRIRFADGEDFSVLKNIRFIREPGTAKDNTHQDNTYLCLTEIELLFLSSAMYDCEKYKGTYLYPAACHEKPENSSEVGNYRPSKEVLTLIDEEQLMEKEKTDEVFLARERFEERLIHSFTVGAADYGKLLADGDNSLSGGLQDNAGEGYWVYE